MVRTSGGVILTLLALGLTLANPAVAHDQFYVAALDDRVVFVAGHITAAATALIDITDSSFPLVEATYCQDLDHDGDCEAGSGDTVEPFCDSRTLFNSANWDPNEDVIIILDTNPLGGSGPCGGPGLVSMATTGSVSHS